MKIGEELAIMAKEKGICKEWFKKMINLDDKDALIDMYIRGIDFCLAKNYPSNEYIAQNFAGVMEKYGIHLNESLNVVNERMVVSLGSCTGQIELNEYSTSEIFIKHDSTLTVVAKDNSFVMIDMFDSSKLHIVASGDTRVCINRYGGDISMEKSDYSIVKVIEKHKNTY